MFFALNLLAPSTDFFEATSTDREAINTAVTVKYALLDAIEAISPLTILRVTKSLYPDLSPSAGAALVLVEVRKNQTVLEHHADSFKQIEDAERVRLAPMMSAAIRRMFAIQPLIDVIKREISNATEDTAKRREALAAAQASKEDIERLAPAFDAADAALRIQVLQAEKASLEKFLKYYDEKDLPAGFVVPEPMKTSQPVEAL